MSPRKSAPLASSLAALALLAACGGESDSAGGTANRAMTNEAAALEPPPLEAPPPMVARSVSYRCDDGRALYVDILTDESVVNVRDARSDLPNRLERESEDAPFVGEERTLSGTGTEVRYSGPDRPEQSCRAFT